MNSQFKAPCGHPGQPIIGTFVNCTVRGCNGTPDDADRDRCRKCGSFDLKPFRVQGLPVDSVNCVACGGVQWPGLDYKD